MTPDQKKKIVRGVIVFAILNLAYSIFSIYTLLSFALIVAGIYVYFQINLREIRKKGLITYLPAKHQKTLLQRSLFDVLCDMWFIPRLSSYAKAIATPFFIKIEPSDAIHQFKDLPAETRKAVLTKGVINILPSSLKAALMPQNELVTDESDASSKIEEIQDSPNDKAIVKPLTAQNPDISSIRASLNMEKNHNSLANRLTQTSTDDDSLVNHNFSLSRQLEVKKAFPSFSDFSPMRAHLDYSERTKEFNSNHNRHHIKRVGPKVDKKFSLDSESDLKSEVLSSSKTTSRKSKGNVKISETWDKLELFTKKRRESIMKQRLGVHMPPQKIEFKGALQTLQNIVSLFSKEGLMNKLEDKKLMKVFIVSSAALLLQFSISKKTRYWCYNTINILMYVTGFALSTGSMGILAIKLKEKYSKWKENQKMEISHELVEKEEEDHKADEDD